MLLRNYFLIVYIQYQFYNTLFIYFHLCNNLLSILYSYSINYPIPFMYLEHFQISFTFGNEVMRDYEIIFHIFISSKMTKDIISYDNI